MAQYVISLSSHSSYSSFPVHCMDQRQQMGLDRHFCRSSRRSSSRDRGAARPIRAHGRHTTQALILNPLNHAFQYLLINLGLSKAFGDLDEERLIFPTKMRVDWVRIYQPVGKKNIGCDPPDFPTSAYIEKCAFSPTHYIILLNLTT